jgi:dTDP-4-amino-4,6-dideoxygalactose transaminase
LSFNGNKIITTSCGGAIVTKTKELKDRAIFCHTIRDDAPYYQHSEIGYNYRMSNICAGIGRGQMEVLDSHVGRTRNAWYQDF